MLKLVAPVVEEVILNPDLVWPRFSEPLSIGKVYWSVLLLDGKNLARDAEGGLLWDPRANLHEGAKASLAIYLWSPDTLRRGLTPPEISGPCVRLGTISNQQCYIDGADKAVKDFDLIWRSDEMKRMLSGSDSGTLEVTNMYCHPDPSDRKRFSRTSVSQGITEYGWPVGGCLAILGEADPDNHCLPVGWANKDNLLPSTPLHLP